MAARRVVAALAALTALAVLAFRRRVRSRRARVDLYFEDGSMVSLADGSADAKRLLPIARDILRIARAQ